MGRHHDPIFTNRPGEPLNPFGVFEGQRILGFPCTVHCERIKDGDSRAKDIFGQAAMRRGGTAIHISGKNRFGHRTGPGFIRELCMYRIDWHGALDPPVGLGCRGPEAACIVTWDDPGWPDVHYRPEQYMRHVFWDACNSFVSFDGVFFWWESQHKFMQGGPLTPQKVCKEIDSRRGRKRGDVLSVQEPEYYKVVRRLLEGMVGVQNNAPAPDPHRPYHKVVLHRVGRWGYGWRRPVAAPAGEV